MLYRPLGNPPVSRLLGAFWDVYHQLRDQLGTSHETPRDVARRHRDILTAVTPRDRAAVQAHFEGVRNRLKRLTPP
ncbi:FCD domain-containing protein [Nonomuraea muscovyensis]|uniref:FCD domain-containing protein n=1 Tax=Nonomuraea muscovyensis TaxID=1124761 RepID=UPI0033CD1355